MKRILSTFLLVAIAGFAMASTATGPLEASAVSPLAAMAAVLFGIPMALRAMGVRLGAGLLLATTITTTTLTAAYEAEYKNNSKGLKDLTSQLYESAEFDKLFTIDYTDLTVWEKAVSSSTSTTQAFQLPFTPNGTHTFDAAKFPLFDIKIDQKFSSHAIKREFIGFMHKQNTPQTAQAFVNYLINEHIKGQHIEDVELYGCWSGVRVAPTPGTAGAVTGMMDGFEKYINDAITATTITPIAVGAAPTDAEDYVTYIETFAKGIANTDKRTPMQLAMSITKEELFMEGMRIKYNTYYRDADNKKRVYVRPNIEVVGLAAMDDSTKVFCAPKQNLIKAVNMGTGNLFNFEVEDRSIKVWADYMLAYGVWNHKRFYTNDVELNPTS